MQPGCSIKITGVKKDTESGSTGEGCYFKNLGYGTGLFTQSAELLLFIEVDKKVFPVPIDKQFREKFRKPGKAYATLSEKRMKKIASAMPDNINVEATGNSRYPYRAEDQEIYNWYLRI